MALTVDGIDELLSDAEARLQRATEERVASTEKENQCLTEVDSLKKLRSIYASRNGGESSPKLDGPPLVQSTFPLGIDVSHIDWIAQAVISHGNTGLTVPELMQEAEAARVKMHPNYPYTALRNLVEKGRLRKDGLRYFAPKQVSAQ